MTWNLIPQKWKQLSHSNFIKFNENNLPIATSCASKFWCNTRPPYAPCTKTLHSQCIGKSPADCRTTPAAHHSYLALSCMLRQRPTNRTRAIARSTGPTKPWPIMTCFHWQLSSRMHIPKPFMAIWVTLWDKRFPPFCSSPPTPPLSTPLLVFDLGLNHSQLPYHRRCFWSYDLLRLHHRLD